RQPPADVVQAARADPADPLLQRPERRKQEVALRAGRVASGSRVAVGAGQARSALPARPRRPEHLVERRTLRRRRLRVRDETEIHYPRASAGSRPLPRAPGPAAASRTLSRASRSPGSSLSTRIAAALNSAVPDFGSVASIVSWLTSTSSGKWNDMNASPAPSESSTRTGASTEPRREETRTTSPSLTSSRSASSAQGH